VSPFPPVHVNAPTFQSSRCLPPERIRACALSSACPANALSDARFANALSSACEEWLRAAGQRGSHRTCSSKVRKPRLDPCPLAIRERLQGRVRHFGFCRWMFPRARPGPLEHPVPRGWSGRLPCWTAKRKPKSNLLELLSEPGNRRRYAGSGVENTESRHSPP
jgi:hypothetical protein